MRRSPSMTELPRFPVTAGTAMLAIGVTIAWWAKMDVSSLFESAMIRRGELWRLVTCILPHLSIWHWYRRAADQGDPGAQNNLAWAYATSTDPAIRNPAAALEYAHKAVTAGKDHPNPIYLDTLAEAYYVNRQFEDAVKTEKLALASAPLESKPDFVKSLEKFEYAQEDNKSQARSK